MPVVNIKGVGDASFPDDMPIADIRTFLRNKYYQDTVQGNSRALDPIPQTVEPYQPSLAQRLGGSIAEGLKGSGLVSDNYGAQSIGRNVASLGEFLPGIGDATAGDEFGRALSEGDKFGMAMAGLGVIPVAGDAAKQALRKVKSIDLPSGKLGSEQFKLIKQSDPKATTKANPDGTVNVTYREEYQPKQLKGPLHEFDPDALELSEGQFKNIDNYRGNKNEPITVTKQGGDYVILDGHHRAKLAKQEGRNVNAVVIPIDDVAKMKKDNIHQADMRKEWIATGGYENTKPAKSPPMDEASINLIKTEKVKNQYGDDITAIDITKGGNKVGAIEYIDDKDSITILRSDVEESQQGKGIGTKAYEKLILEQLAKGKAVNSDAIVSPQAEKVYEKLKKKGFNVSKAENLGFLRRGVTTADRESRIAQRKAAPLVTDSQGNVTNKPFRIKGSPVYTIKP